MDGVDSVNTSLYFQAAQQASLQQAKETKKQEALSKSKKTQFGSQVQKAQDEYFLKAEGFPPEIASMDLDEAVVFLKDEADIAAEKLIETQTQENFVAYKKKVSQFLRYIEKNNFEIKTISRGRNFKTGQEKDPYKQIEIVNQKLEQIAEWLLHDHRRTFNMLAKVEEIQGLLVDLIAA